MSIQNIQTEFAEALFSDDNNSSSRGRPGLNHAGVNSTGRRDLFQPFHHLSIYRHNVTANLVNTLLAAYPLIVRLVGENCFRSAAKAYIEDYPSRSANLHDYGAYFSDYLATYPPVKNLPYLTEVATFEWICHTLHFAADPIPFDVKILEIVSPEQYEHLHFMLHPASYVMQFHYPMLRIIDLCKGDMNEQIDVNEGGIQLLIIRRDLEIMLVPLTLADYTFLAAIQMGSSLLASLEAALTIDADFNLEEKLPAWIHDKTIVDVITD
jgi:hypothetical protein